MRTLHLGLPLRVQPHYVRNPHSYVHYQNIHYRFSGNGHVGRFLPKNGVRYFTLQGFLTPPAVFTGLVLALWFYKCCMMVIFQNKIIYMPSVPSFSRSEKIADYAARCKPVEWREQHIAASDGTSIAVAVGSMPATFMKNHHVHHQPVRIQKHKLILYLQG